MEHLLAVMLLVGCTADSQTCNEIQVPTPFYASVAECQNDLPLQMRMTNTPDDRVLGSCLAIEESVLDQSGTLEWAVTRGGQLVTEFVLDDADAVASLPDQFTSADESTELQLASR